VLAETPGDLDERTSFEEFAAHSLGYLQPGQDVIAEVVTAALYSALEGDVRDRFYYWRGPWTFETMRNRDGALFTVMYFSSPGNLPVVRRLTNALADQVGLGRETALLATLCLYRRLLNEDEPGKVWEDAQRDILDRHSSALSAWSKRTPWAGINAGTEPDQLVARFGPWSLYLSDAVLIVPLPSVAERLLDSNSSHELAGLSEALTGASRPWISDERWWSEVLRLESYGWARENTVVNARWGKAPLAPMVLLCLPYLEMHAHRHLSVSLPESVPVLHRLATARAEGETDSDLLRLLESSKISNEVQDFLISWVCGEFDVVAPPPADLVLGDGKAQVAGAGG
jgi:hypothetical protein